MQKSRAKMSVIRSLEKSSSKLTRRAKLILSGVMSELKKEPDFDENKVILDQSKEKIDCVERVIEHASKAVKNLGQGRHNHHGGGKLSRRLLGNINTSRRIGFH